MNYLTLRVVDGVNYIVFCCSHIGKSWGALLSMKEKSSSKSESFLWEGDVVDEILYDFLD